VLLRVTNHVPARDLPVAQVRDRIVAAVRAQRASKAAAAVADAMVAKLKGGATVAAVAAERGLVPFDLPGMSRGMPVPDAKATEAFFAVPAPAAGKSVPGSVRLGDGSHIVFAVTKVTPGDPTKASPEQRAGLQRQLAQSGGADDARAFIAAMRRSMDVDVAEERL